MQQYMQDDQEQTRSPKVSTRRLEMFSDGIFAIAITLLALNLEVPTLTTITPQTLVAVLWMKWPTYLTFLFSFVTVLIAWIYHHDLLQLAKYVERGMLFSNGVLLLIVSAIPFPTALLGAYVTTPATSVACAIYAGYIGVLNFTYNLLWWVVMRQHRLEGWRPPVNMVLSFLGFPCSLIAVGIAFWSPVATLIICIALWVVWTAMAPGVKAAPSKKVQS